MNTIKYSLELFLRWRETLKASEEILLRENFFFIFFSFLLM